MNKTMQQKFQWLLTVTASLALMGCGESREFELAPVSGKVTLNGEPLVGAQVLLQPTGGSENPGPSSTGLTNESGEYVMKTIDGEEGAVVGHHRVAITSNPFQEVPAGDQDVGPNNERVPMRYNLNSSLTIDISKEGDAKADFEITSP